MKVRVLGCSGAIARDCRTTSFLIDDDLLIDAGTGVGDLTLDEMRAIRHVFLTHSHLDHIAALPLMVDATASTRREPLQIHALAETLVALKTHLFNDVIWPDFSRIPSLAAPLVAFHELLVGAQLAFTDRQIEVLPAVHTVPAVGYAISAGGSAWVFSGDTERNPRFWQRVNQLDVGMLVIETAFSNRETAVAERSLHLSPTTLAAELGQIAADKRFPIYISHTKPAETELIMREIDGMARSQRARPGGRLDIRQLAAGQVFEL
ncbi:MAG: CAMP phosphodiesterases class-II:metallo-beta-lactamase superfamily [Burkholderiaceae bacterium]|jgi:ribonuclease BN (tRNA processing enzyme)|nr:MAG: CAMP phosphodiesterases class-II:metallo-beta-lactamase superfamily [Burkholderiaceae bacterium]